MGKFKFISGLNKFYSLKYFMLPQFYCNIGVWLVFVFLTWTTPTKSQKISHTSLKSTQSSLTNVRETQEEKRKQAQKHNNEENN